MSIVDGEWDVSVSSPMGEQKSVATLRAEGGVLTGWNASSVETQPILDGKIDGNALSWSMEATSPFPITLEFEATITGDRIEGDVKAGMFGKMKLVATRRPGPSSR
jgi:hypothetical protein